MTEVQAKSLAPPNQCYLSEKLRLRASKPQRQQGIFYPTLDCLRGVLRAALRKQLRHGYAESIKIPRDLRNLAA